MILYKHTTPESQEQLLNLYISVGWTWYVAEADKLMEAIRNSSYVISAYQDEELVGLIRGLSDGFSVHFIQDLLVHPAYQRQRIGRSLLEKALEVNASVHKHLLLTDDEQFQKHFYRALGFMSLTDIRPVSNAYLKMAACPIK